MSLMGTAQVSSPPYWQVLPQTARNLTREWPISRRCCQPGSKLYESVASREEISSSSLEATDSVYSAVLKLLGIQGNYESASRSASFGAESHLDVPDRVRKN